MFTDLLLSINTFSLFALIQRRVARSAAQAEYRDFCGKVPCPRLFPIAYCFKIMYNIKNTRLEAFLWIIVPYWIG